MRCLRCSRSAEWLARGGSAWGIVGLCGPMLTYRGVRCASVLESALPEAILPFANARGGSADFRVARDLRSHVAESAAASRVARTRQRPVGGAPHEVHTTEEQVLFLETEERLRTEFR